MRPLKDVFVCATELVKPKFSYHLRNFVKD